MKRRDFVKGGICLGCAGAMVSLCKNYQLLNLSDITGLIEEKKFIYKNISELPKKIRLDLCTMCQLNCVKCWMRENEEKIKKYSGFGYVSFETFKNFIDKYPVIEDIEIACKGEIFLNPELDKILEYAYKKGIRLAAESGVNLNYIAEKTAEALVKYKVRTITVSIDGASPETYAIYRRGGDFNKVINNIKMINKYKEKYNSEYPVMEYKFIIFGHNEHEIEKAKKLAKELNMDIKFALNGFPEYSPVKNIDKVRELTGFESIYNQSQEFFNDYSREKTDWFMCTDLFNRPQIDYNGELMGCCVPYTQAYGVNVFKVGLLEALNDKKYVYAKRMLTNLNVKPKYDIPCNNCEVYKLLKEKNFPIKRY